MKTIGYTYTIIQIASHLAQLGVLLISSPLPFIILVAMIVGCAIYAFSIAVPYALYDDTIVSTTSVWYYNSSYEIAKSKQETAFLVVTKENGATYWQAWTANYLGFGGLKLGDPITLYQAKTIVELDNSVISVMALTLGHAQTLATQTAKGKGFYTSVECHRPGMKYLNWQHIHTYPYFNSSIPGNTHILFFMPLNIPYN